MAGHFAAAVPLPAPRRRPLAGALAPSLLTLICKLLATLLQLKVCSDGLRDLPVLAESEHLLEHRMLVVLPLPPHGQVRISSHGADAAMHDHRLAAALRSAVVVVSF